jgi:hypothetical protein
MVYTLINGWNIAHIPPRLGLSYLLREKSFNKQAHPALHGLTAKKSGLYQIEKTSHLKVPRLPPI